MKKAAKKKTAVKKKAAPKTARKKSSSASKRLTPSKTRRGLQAEEIRLDLEEPELVSLVADVIAAEGVPIGAYREPFSGQALLLASLPLNAVAPTPFQRDLSPTHTKRLAEKIEESGSFLDPLIVVQGAEGRFWTPNGSHRLAAAKILGLRQVTALISPDEILAFRILALNTEKAHNLKDRSLEVIRMARELAARRSRGKESGFSAEFESPELLTLGIIYEENKRFAGGAYRPFLKKVDRFLDNTLSASLRKREDFASRLLAIDGEVKRLIEGLRERGFKSPYLRSYVVARINPVRWHRAKKGDTEAAMPMSAALIRMSSAARKFDLDSVKFSDLALVAAVASDEE